MVLLAQAALVALAAPLFDPMTEAMLEAGEAERLFETHPRGALGRVPLGSDARAALSRVNESQGLALSDGEIAYLADVFARLGRDPTDVEVMMFAQANSEHCRHKIFNADWRIDGIAAARSPFAMIRQHQGPESRRRALSLQRQFGGHRGTTRLPVLPVMRRT